MLHRFLNKDSYKNASDAVASLVRSASDTARIEHELHNFYKYPACFSPLLVNELIRAFSARGDTIVDPFVGGGTAAVESMLLGRRFVGTDLNDLAVFSSKVKTTQLAGNSISVLDKWIGKVSSIDPPSDFDLDEYADIPDLKDLPLEISYFLGKIKESFRKIDDSAVRRFAQCVVLRAAKIRMEGPREKLHFDDLKNLILELYEKMIEANIEAKHIISSRDDFFKPKILKGDNTSSKTVDRVLKAVGRQKVKLIVTSPPYPGISVLYNRWQVHGRRETMVPYWLIDSDQRKSASFFTMGHPKTQQGLDDYFRQIQESFTNIYSYIDKNTLITQLVAFGDKKTQFFAFMDAMSDSGFSEIKNITAKSFDGRIWRSVANRKWYNSLKEKSSNRNEVLLFFRRKS